jgi:hypothetical protein
MGASTDTNNVNLHDDPMQRRLDGVLSSLPPLYVVATGDDARFVAGPSGAFVLLPHLETNRNGAGISAAATRLDQLVQSTRTALCDHLSWIPFLDSLLVSEADIKGPTPVTIVALDLLHDVLTEGPAVIDGATLAAIRAAVRAERLDHWTVGSADGAARIDLCDPAPSTTTR